MNKYKITLTKEFFIKAKDPTDAYGLAVEKCADDSEMLMPHNMERSVVSATTYPDSFFDN